MTLKIAAEYADYTNFDGSPEGFAAKSAILEQHCKDVGRDFGSIVRWANYNVIIGESEKDVEDRMAWIEDSYRKAGVSDASIRAQARTSAAVPGRHAGADRRDAAGPREAGMTYAITNFREAAFDTSGMELFESAVIPELRGS